MGRVYRGCISTHRGLCVQRESTYRGMCEHARGGSLPKESVPGGECAQGERAHDVCLCRASWGLCECVSGSALGV